MTPSEQIQRVMATFPVPAADVPIGACVRNVLAKLAITPREAPLIECVEALVVAKDERLYVKADTAFWSRMVGWSKGDDPVFAKEGTPRSSVHQEMLGWLALQPDAPHFTLISFRERVTFNSLQCVVALSPRPGSDYVDCDIDLGGALTDVVGFVAHQLELPHGITDHLKMRQQFLRDPVLGPLVA